MTFTSIQVHLQALTSILAVKYRDMFAPDLASDYHTYVKSCDAAYMEGGPYFTDHHRTCMMTHISSILTPNSQELNLAAANLIGWLFTVTDFPAEIFAGHCNVGS